MKNLTLNISEVRFDYLKSWNIEKLMTPFWHFYWNPENQAKIVIREVVTKLYNDHFYLIPANTPYRTSAPCPIEHFYMHFDLNHFFKKQSVLRFPLDCEIKCQLKRITRLCQSEQTEAIQTEKLLLAKSLAYSAISRVPLDLFNASPNDLKMEQVIHYISTHLKSGACNQTLADIAGMSLSGFLRKFHQRFSITPAKYIALQRISEVASRLKNQTESIEFIAEQTGFYDRYHMSKVFKRYRGITPAVYRKNHTP